MADDFAEIIDQELRAFAAQLRAVEHWQPKRAWSERVKARLLGTAAEPDSAQQEETAEGA